MTQNIAQEYGVKCCQKPINNVCYHSLVTSPPYERNNDALFKTSKTYFRYEQFSMHLKSKTLSNHKAADSTELLLLTSTMQ